MNFDVKTIDNFKRELKRLLKKYPSLRKEVEELGFSLADDPFQGAAMRDGFYKIRLAIKSKGKGKRSGVRVITCVKVVDETVFLVSIYDKAEQSDIAEAELTRLLTEIPD
jgi:mRNA-degrading endonuclease RelE of RelBE toxin-antitoxin system